MSDVPMHPQPPSNEDGFFGRSDSEAEFDAFEGADAPESDENSWLLSDEPAAEDGDTQVHESVQALPGEFGEAYSPGGGTIDPASAEDAASIDELLESYAQPEETLGASFVEPETTSGVLSRALVPAGAALLVSFSGIAVWAFLKNSGASADPTTIQIAAPDVVDTLEGNNVELVAPVGTDSVVGSGRISFQRDGSQKVIGTGSSQGGQRRGPAATVSSPREPGELPPSAKTNTSAASVVPTGLVGSAPAEPVGAGVPGDAAPTKSGDDERPSFSNFGGGLAAATTTDDLEVQEGDEADGESRWDTPVDPDVADEVLDAFGSLEDDLFLSQAFMDSVVLSIDPIDEVVSIYGDIEAYIDQDSFASLGFDRTEPFDSSGFGDFTVADWEGYDEVETLADADDASSFDADVPFGMFPESFMVDVEDTMASVDVGPEPSVVPTVVGIDEVSSPETEVAKADVAEEAPELTTEPSLEQAPIELEEVVSVDEVAAAEIELGEVTLGAIVPEVAPEGAVEPALEAVLEPVTEVVADALPEPDSSTEPQTVEVQLDSMPASPEPVAVAAAPELDLDAANARLDAMFGPVADLSASEEGPAVDAPGIELDPLELRTELADLSEPAPSAPVGEPAMGMPADQGDDPELVVDNIYDEIFGEPAQDEVAAAEEPAAVEPEVDTLQEDLAGWALTSTPVELLEPSVDVELEEPSEVLAESTDSTEPAGETQALEAQPEEVAVAIVTEPAGPKLAQPSEEISAPGGPTPDDFKAEPMGVGAEVAITQVALAEPADTDEPVEVLNSIAEGAEDSRRSSTLRRAETDGVWKNRTVPKNKLRGDRFVLTPNVGNVRIIFDGGETVDGRLHGVGDDRIVLDTKLGRMTLDARRAGRIDRIGNGRNRELRSPSESYASTKGLDRVKVRAAGGVFYGHLVAQTDTKVTLLLEGGTRVTLDATEVETSKARRATSRLKRN